MAQSKIHGISIQNFKFFAQKQEIKVDGKHILLYGENGSGKSSVYWSLYTLFQDAKQHISGHYKELAKAEGKKSTRMIPREISLVSFVMENRRVKNRELKNYTALYFYCSGL